VATHGKGRQVVDREFRGARVLVPLATPEIFPSVLQVIIILSAIRINRVSLDVGYKAEELQEGATMVAPCFVNIGESENIDLLDLTVGGEYGSGDIVVQTLTAAGLADKTYTFQQNPRTKVWEWIDDDNAAVGEGEVMFPAGAGLWIAAVDGVTITIPGPTL